MIQIDPKILKVVIAGFVAGVIFLAVTLNVRDRYEKRIAVKAQQLYEQKIAYVIDSVDALRLNDAFAEVERKRNITLNSIEVLSAKINKHHEERNRKEIEHRERMKSLK